SGTSNLLPANLGIDAAGTNQLINEYNNLVLQRNRMLKSAQPQNPMLVSLNDQIQEIRNNVMQSLEQRRSNLRIAQDNLQRQAGILGSQISEVPGQERQFRGIERQQNIKEALYLFLLQKREENSLALAVTAPKAKIVDQAYGIGGPVSPNPQIAITVAVLAGLFLPFLFINAKNILNNKVRHREDVKKVTTSIPIIGEIPKTTLAENETISKKERSALSEAFNILSANLQYVIDKQHPSEKGTCIFVTSSLQAEGKTFTVMNLGISLAVTGKKTLVLGADLRNPQLQRYGTSGKKLIGVSDYLTDNMLDLHELIEDSNIDPNLKILHSGTVPTDPTGVLRKDKMDHLFAELKQVFDYIIVDTAPAMLLADIFLINRHADLTLYLVRAGYTKKKFLEFAEDTKREGRLKNMLFVLNDVSIADSRYGNNYGYAYGENRKDLPTRAEEMWSTFTTFFVERLNRLRK
ncbi:MAG: polysaccharide biosynthesis tyrosine autokinase, partial [Pricia sp.]